MGSIPDHVQDAVDRYIELNAVIKQLEERTKPLRELILSFIKDNELESIWDRRQSGKVQLIVTDRAATTSRFSSYDAEELSKIMEPDLLNRCLVKVVDRDKLEGLVKLGEIASEILGQKITKKTYSVTVRYEK